MIAYRIGPLWCSVSSKPTFSYFGRILQHDVDRKPQATGLPNCQNRSTPNVTKSYASC
jgi:hypothetical protein